MYSVYEQNFVDDDNGCKCDYYILSAYEVPATAGLVLIHYHL